MLQYQDLTLLIVWYLFIFAMACGKSVAPLAGHRISDQASNSEHLALFDCANYDKNANVSLIHSFCHPGYQRTLERNGDLCVFY